MKCAEGPKWADPQDMSKGLPKSFGPQSYNNGQQIKGAMGSQAIMQCELEQDLFGTYRGMFATWTQLLAFTGYRIQQTKAYPWNVYLASMSDIQKTSPWSQNESFPSVFFCRLLNVVYSQTLIGHLDRFEFIFYYLSNIIWMLVDILSKSKLTQLRPGLFSSSAAW